MFKIRNFNSTNSTHLTAPKILSMWKSIMVWLSKNMLSIRIISRTYSNLITKIYPKYFYEVLYWLLIYSQKLCQQRSPRKRKRLKSLPRVSKKRISNSSCSKQAVPALKPSPPSKPTAMTSLTPLWNWLYEEHFWYTKIYFLNYQFKLLNVN